MALLAVAAVIASSAAVVTTTEAFAAPPPNPTPQQLQDAQNKKTALAGQVGDLTAQLASLQTQLEQLKGQAEAAEQKFALAQSNLEQAQNKEAQAKAQVASAQQAVKTAQQQFLEYAQAVYMTGQVGGTTGSLLTASDPSALLDQSALQQYQTTHQLTAIGQLQQATVAQSNADSAARKAVQQEQAAETAASQAKQQAEQAVQNAQAQQAQVQQQQNEVESELKQAADNLSRLNGERAAYVKWQAHQEWLRQQAILKAQREAAARAAAQAAAAARRAAAAANASAQTSTSSNDSAPIPSGGSWTAEKGRAAVARAENWLGETYIWAGGNASGPTTGGCTDPVAPCGVLGFDCSGLALYAWAPFEYMPHYAASQYWVAGHYHPSPGNFQPGDLLFWSDNGSASGIHHVAIYIGNGNVIQAPESGDVVRVTPWDQVDWGYYGATRPLT